MEAPRTPLPYRVIRLEALMGQGGLTQARMGKGEIVLTQFPHHQRGMFDEFDLSATRARVRNRLGVPDQPFRAPKGKLLVYLSHSGLHRSRALVMGCNLA
jgi:hypothetical protein